MMNTLPANKFHSINPRNSCNINNFHRNLIIEEASVVVKDGEEKSDDEGHEIIYHYNVKKKNTQVSENTGFNIENYEQRNVRSLQGGRNISSYKCKQGAIFSQSFTEDITKSSPCVTQYYTDTETKNCSNVITLNPYHNQWYDLRDSYQYKSMQEDIEFQALNHYCDVQTADSFSDSTFMMKDQSYVEEGFDLPIVTLDSTNSPPHIDKLPARSTVLVNSKLKEAMSSFSRFCHQFSYSNAQSKNIKWAQINFVAAILSTLCYSNYIKPMDFDTDSLSVLELMERYLTFWILFFFGYFLLEFLFYFIFCGLRKCISYVIGVFTKEEDYYVEGLQIVNRHPALFTEKQLQRLKTEKQHTQSLLSRSSKTQREYCVNSNRESIPINLASSSYGSIQSTDGDVDILIPFDIEGSETHYDLSSIKIENKNNFSLPNSSTKQNLRRIDSMESCNHLPQDLFPINEDFVCIEG